MFRSLTKKMVVFVDGDLAVRLRCCRGGAICGYRPEERVTDPGGVAW